MPIQKITESKQIDIDLIKTDVIYRFESLAQLAHHRFNLYLKELYPDAVQEKFTDRQKKQLKLDLCITLTAETEELLYTFIETDVQAINKELGNSYSENEIKGITVHLKQLLLPFDQQLMFNWLSRFSFQMINPTSFDSCLFAIGMRLWFRSSQIRSMNELVLKRFSEELVSEALSLTHLMKQHVHYGFLKIIISQFMQKLMAMYNSDMPKEQKCLVMWKAPSYLTKDYPLEVLSDISSAYTQIFINNEAEKLGIPTIVSFIRENEDRCLGGKAFPFLEFRMWMTKKQDQYAQSILANVKLLKSARNNKLPDGMFIQLELPSGMYFSINALGLVNYYIDLLKILDSSDDNKSAAFANLYLNAFNDDHDVWVAICMNIIRVFTKNLSVLPKDHNEANLMLKPIVLMQLLRIMYHTQSKRIDTKNSIIDEAFLNIYSSEMSVLEKNMYKNVESKHANILRSSVILNSPTAMLPS